MSDSPIVDGDLFPFGDVTEEQFEKNGYGPETAEALRGVHLVAWIGGGGKIDSPPETYRIEICCFDELDRLSGSAPLETLLANALRGDDAGIAEELYAARRMRSFLDQKIAALEKMEKEES